MQLREGRLEMRLFILFGLIAASLALDDSNLCSNPFSQSKPPSDFSLRLFHKITAFNPDENVVFSPLSIGATLAFLAKGAAGDTKVALESFLYQSETHDNTTSWIDCIMAERLESSNETKAPVFSMANGLFVGHDLTVKKKFLKTVHSFGADVQDVNFNDKKSAADLINHWVSNATNATISNLIDPELLQDAEAVLANAIYFKAGWDKKFAESDVKADFYKLGKEKQQVTYIRNEAEYDYFDDDFHHIVQIPYDHKYSMFILLPKKRDGIHDLEKLLFTGDLMPKILNGPFVSKRVELKVPKFTIQSPIPLTKHLKALGLGDLFSNKANFSGISDEPLRLSSVIHEAFIKVDEKGTEASAATAAIFQERSGPKPPIPFIVEHPFIFAIMQTEPLAPIFFGKVTHVEQ